MSTEQIANNLLAAVSPTIVSLANSGSVKNCHVCGTEFTTELNCKCPKINKIWAPLANRAREIINQMIAIHGFVPQLVELRNASIVVARKASGRRLSKVQYESFVVATAEYSRTGQWPQSVTVGNDNVWSYYPND